MSDLGEGLGDAFNKLVWHFQKSRCLRFQKGPRNWREASLIPAIPFLDGFSLLPGTFPILSGKSFLTPGVAVGSAGEGKRAR